MARVLKGSHSFKCTPRVHPLTEWTSLPSQSWYSFTDPGRMEGWVGLGPRTTWSSFYSAQRLDLFAWCVSVFERT